MNRTARRGLIFGSVMALMLTVVLSVVIYRQRTGGVAYIIVEPGNNRLCFEDGSVLNGWDSYGCTYFFVPSYMDFTRLSYDNSGGRIYSSDGELLEHPSIGEIEDVLVETAEGMAEYRVGFFKSENLYTFNLETYDTDIDDVEREECVSVSLNVISPSGVEVYRDQEVLIKGRGNNSWEQSRKRPYELKFKDDVSFLDMEKSDNWTLLSNGEECTRLCNKLAYTMAEGLGMEYYINADWIDVYFDGVYWGNYLLCKEPDIRDLDETVGNLQKENRPFTEEEILFDDGDIKGFEAAGSPSNITGDYLMEFDPYADKRKCGFYLRDGLFIHVKSPNNATRNEMEYISSYIKDFDNDGLSYADKFSFARRYLVEEVFLNYDNSVASSYFYKKRNDDRIYAGPCWDYDGSGLVIYDPDNITRYSVMEVRGRGSDWDVRLLEDVEYQEYVTSIFRKNAQFLDRLQAKQIDRYYEKIKASLNMDYYRWRDINKEMGYVYGNHYSLPENNIRFMKHAMYERLCFLAERWGVEHKFKEPDRGNGSTHTVTFEADTDGEEGEDNIVIQVKDGEMLTDDTTGDIINDDDIWINQATGDRLSRSLPVYEDMVFCRE